MHGFSPSFQITKTRYLNLEKMAKGKKGGKKTKKNASNVFSMFEPSQIQEFKEAFGMIDANRDGFIDKEDLIATYASLGVTNVESSRLDDMIKVR